MTRPIKVLMLGWEFPPHISGGLGTACLGIAKGLSAHDVEILFVVPRAYGDEDRSFGDVIGADSVAVRLSALDAPASWATLRTRLARGRDPVAADGDREAEPAGPDSSEGVEPGDYRQRELDTLARRLRVLEVASPLAPYLTPEQYAARVADLTEPNADAAMQGPTVLGSPSIGETTTADSSTQGGRAAAALAEGEGTLSFEGSYGEDLFAEVARYARVVEALAERETFDVVHAHDWMTYPAGIVAARTAGKPLVAHLHASEFDRSGEGVNDAVCDIEHLGLVAADRVICVSHFLSRIVRERYGIDAAKIRVVHNAVTQGEHARQIHWEKENDVPVVLFLGRVTHQKGPGYFLEAAARVVRIEPNVKFVISGSGDLLPGVIDQAAALGLARHVHFTGFLRGLDVERMYAMADIYVMPSVSEPFGIAPLEAMAADVPVIVSNQSGVAEVVTNALKVDYWDVDDIANKILALLKHEALVDHMRDEGGEEVRRQRWEFRGGIVRDIYEEVVT